MTESDNTMKWFAVYKDETIFPQYNEDGSENLFGKIEMTQLRSFFWADEDKDLIYGFNPNTGDFILNGMQIRFKDWTPECELVAFRRQNHTFDGSFQEIDHITAYCIGYRLGSKTKFFSIDAEGKIEVNEK